jgi:CRP-like cAMP-binding protein
VSSSWTELPDNGVMSPANITQSDLASLCGGSRENVNRALAELQKRGLIARDGHRYVLKDVAGLRRVAKV